MWRVYSAISQTEKGKYYVYSCRIQRKWRKQMDIAKQKHRNMLKLIVTSGDRWEKGQDGSKRLRVKTTMYKKKISQKDIIAAQKIQSMFYNNLKYSLPYKYIQ